MMRAKYSFDDTDTLIEKGFQLWPGGGAIPAISAGNGRYGTDSMRCTQNRAWLLPLPGNLAEWVIPFSWRNNNIDGTTQSIMLAFFDNNVVQCCVKQRLDGKIEFRQATTAGFGDGTLLAGPSDQALPSDVTVHVEIKVEVGSAGSLAVRINGVEWLAFSGDTQQTANAYATAIGGGDIYNGLGAGAIDYDDLIIKDVTGTYNNNYNGDRHVTAQFPIGAGTDTDYIVSLSPGANHEGVDENPPNDDDTYVESDTVTDRDNYTFEDLPEGVTSVDAMGINHRARKTDSGLRSIAGEVLSGGTYGTGPDLALSDEYADFQTIFEEDPDTSNPWDVAGVNASKCGQQTTV